MNYTLPLLFLGSASLAAAQTEKPNIIFIVTDDQHRDQFNFLPEGRDSEGAFLNLTPNIDRLWQNGVILDNCHVSTSVCTPSRYSILTGTYASRAVNENFLADAGRYNQTNVHWNVDIIPGIHNIASVLQANGYFTGGVGKNHVIAGDNVFKVPTSADPADPEVIRQLKANQQAQVDAYKANGFDFAASIYKGNLPTSYPVALEDHNMEWIVSGALDFLDLAAEKEKPFFLYFATTLEHGPDELGSKYLGNPLATPVGFLEKELDVMPSRESITSRIEEKGLPATKADVLWLDDGIGALLAKLEKTGMLENTVIFYIDDHGVESGKGSLYEGGVKTVAFAWGPKYFNSGTRTTQLISNIDLVPTVFDISGVKAPQNYHIDGCSILSLLKGSEKEIHRSLYFEIGATRAVFMDNWKYLAFRTPEPKKALLNVKGKQATHINDQPGGRGSEKPAIKHYPAYFDEDQLYDLNNDPDEQANLYTDLRYRKTRKKLQKELQHYLKDLPFSYDELKP